MQPPGTPLVVKVGGSLLRRDEDYAAIAQALAPMLRQGPVWIVVSAAKDATDALARVAQGSEAPSTVLRFHEALAQAPLAESLVADFQAAATAAAAGDCDALMAWGEQASAALLQRHLETLGFAVPVVELAPSHPAPDIPHAIVPGFFVRGAAGRLHILPRGGSDISAVLTARWCGAQEVHLWKQGGGIRLEPGVTVERIGAPTLLAWLGNRVRPIHPAAVRLAAQFGLALSLQDPWGIDGSTRIEEGARSEVVVPAMAEPLATADAENLVSGEAAP